MDSICTMIIIIYALSLMVTQPLLLIIAQCHTETTAVNVSPVTVDQEYGTEDVRVTLEWNQDQSIMYSIKSVPSVPVLFGRSSVAELNVSYNIMYNVSIAPRCGLGTATVVELHYGK